jgi:hypothetical protein
VKTIFPLLATASILCACAETHVPTPHPVDFATISQDRPGTLTILSDPPGAVVQVNGKSIGSAPCTAEIPVLESNHAWLLAQNVTVTALPPKEGQVLQTKFFERFTVPPKQVAFEFLKKTGKSGGGEEEEFSSEWDRITGGRSHEIGNVH